jgi:FkbM family methyltransferase
MKSFKKIVRKATIIANKLLDNFKPFIRKRTYLGFSLFYSKGTSLVEMIDKETSVYEPDTCKILRSYIESTESPSFIDIGSNIGLISLYMLRYIPEIKIYAFDPGPHQSMLFRKTIGDNKLEKNVQLYEIALSNKDGKSSFNIHDTRHVSADGLIDTERAGETSRIEISTKRLDTWWHDSLNPNINLIKIDTEGAELWVLEGAQELIKKCKPVIMIEMNSINYRNYPYDIKDVYNYLINLEYSVFTFNNEPVDLNNIQSFQDKYIDTYICLPSEKAE